MKLLLQCAALVFLVSCNSESEVTVIAHRGAPGYLPEHTLEGAAMAHAWDVDYIEPDLVLTKDDHLVILHDHHLDTTTNVAKIYPERSREDGRFYAVDFTLNELKTLNVHERIDLKTGRKVFPNRFPLNKSSFRIPSFKEFIELVQGLNKTTGKTVGIYPEIKKPEFHLKEGKDITKAVIKIMREYGYEESKNAFIQSFWPRSLKRLKEEFKTGIPLIQLIADNSWKESSADYSIMLTNEGQKKIAKYAQGIGPAIHQIIGPKSGEWKSTGVVGNARKHGLLIHAYTHRIEQIPKGLSEKELFQLLFKELQIDGIFSDFADRVPRS
ncbi:MAG: glycerophosphodiester phosphodiesterase [Bacteriovoracaceae bacterium]